MRVSFRSHRLRDSAVHAEVLRPFKPKVAGETAAPALADLFGQLDDDSSGLGM